MAKIHDGGPLDVPNESLDVFLYREMTKYNSQLCVIDESSGTSYTYAQVVDTAHTIAKALTFQKVLKNDFIVFCKRNSLSFVPMFIGAIETGARAVMVNPNSTVYELKHYLKDVHPKFIFTDTDLINNIQQAVVSLDLKCKILVDDDQPDTMSLDSFLKDGSLLGMDFVNPVVDPRRDVAVLLFSSGTTGLPKAVMLSHYNVIATLLVLREYKPPGENFNLTQFPFCHIAGLRTSLLARLVSGTTVVIFERFKMEDYLKAIQKYKPVALHIAPPVMVMLAKSDLVERYDTSSIRLVHVAAASVKRELEDVFKKKFNNPTVVQAYGLTETTGGVIRKRLSHGHIKGGSVGTPNRGVQAKVINPDTGDMLGPHQQGEIYLRGAPIMLRYLNNPDATNTILDAEGWIHSGDLGYYDEDGFFFIVDRLKELIKYKAYQVAPAELDAMLLEHPDIADAAVVGLPDKEAGELPCAFVVKKPGVDVTESDIITFADERVSHFKRLRGGIHFIDAIPKLASGKILRRKLKERLVGSRL